MVRRRSTRLPPSAAWHTAPRAAARLPTARPAFDPGRGLLPALRRARRARCGRLPSPAARAPPRRISSAACRCTAASQRPSRLPWRPSRGSLGARHAGMTPAPLSIRVNPQSNLPDWAGWSQLAGSPRSTYPCRWAPVYRRPAPREVLVT